ncbi:MAG: DUF4173 domain-containing protein [Acidimicrobiia bacterium]|nr:DUF4173 domain-containing protein [Acidimicrobiia bacterium]
MSDLTSFDPIEDSSAGPVEPPSWNPWNSRDAAARIGALALVTGLLLDRVVSAAGPHPDGVGAGVGATLMVAVAGLGVLAAGPRPRSTYALVLSAVGFGLVASLRTSPWAVVPSLAAAVGLLYLAVFTRRGRSSTALAFDDLAGLARRAGAAGAWAPVDAVALGITASGGLGRRRASAAGRALLVAGPVLVTVAALLASADAVFASFLDVGLSPRELVPHVVVVGVGIVMMSGIVGVDRHAPTAVARRPRRWLRAGEATTVVGGLAVLFALFALAQVAAAAAGEDYVRQRTGLSYAEYARSGFFQLLAVAMITATLLIAVPAATGPVGARAGRRLQVACLAVAGLTEVIVGVAIVRLQLYSDEYGYTMLRVSSTLVALWIGFVFVAIAARTAGLGPKRWSLASIVVFSALAALGGADVANLEAFVVRANIERAGRGHELDVDYLAGRSDDAAGALADALATAGPARGPAAGQLSEADRARLGDALCAADRSERGLWDANLAASSARDRRTEWCGERPAASS